MCCRGGSQTDSAFELPDGNVIEVCVRVRVCARVLARTCVRACVQPGSERYRCAEALFNPSLIGIDARGIHELAHEAILKVWACVHKRARACACVRAHVGVCASAGLVSWVPLV